MAGNVIKAGKQAMARTEKNREAKGSGPPAAGRGNFAPGFRMSETDAGFIILVLVSSPLLGRLFVQLAVAALFVVCHFFLFCNVLRARRLLELLWAAAFVVLWSCSFALGVPSWGWTYVLALAFTVVIAVIQIRLPSYHGAFWKVLNPRLPQWWEKNAGTGLIRP